jgi:hypothetical protein
MGIATKEATRAAAIMDERAPDGELSSRRASTHASSSWDALCTQGKRQRAVRGAHQHGTALCVLSFLLPRCHVHALRPRRCGSVGLSQPNCSGQRQSQTKLRRTQEGITQIEQKFNERTGIIKYYALVSFLDAALMPSNKFF